MNFLAEFVIIVFVFTHAIVGCVCASVVLTFGSVLALYWFRLSPPNGEIKQLIGKPYIIAHRGAGHDAPENTLAAVKQAKEAGATAVEFDVEYTEDGVAVVFHDDTLDRCTDGTGSINCAKFEKTRILNASVRHQKEDLFPNEKIPTLEEMIQLCLSLDLIMYIDVKSNVKKSTEVLLDLFKRYPDMYNKAIVCSFNPLIVYSVRKRDKNIVGGLIHMSRGITSLLKGKGPWYKKLVCTLLDVFLMWSAYSWLLCLCGNTVFLAHYGDVSESVVERFSNRGVQVCVWTVNRRHDRNYFLHSLRCPVITDTMKEEGC